MLWTIAIIIALIIILALGVYAGRLLFMLKQQNARPSSGPGRAHS